MKTICIALALVAVVSSGCSPTPPRVNPNKRNEHATKQQEQEIRNLIEQLAFANTKASKEPLISPGITNNTDEYRAKFEKCQTAFRKLSAQGARIPLSRRASQRQAAVDPL